jgi:hypothetical protein
MLLFSIDQSQSFWAFVLVLEVSVEIPDGKAHFTFDDCDNLEAGFS